MNRRMRVLSMIMMVMLLSPQIMACSPMPTPTPAPLAIGQPTITPTPPVDTPAPAPIATPAPSPTPQPVEEAREVALDALWYDVGSQGPFGGISRVMVRVEPNPSREVRVGFYEEEVMGSGPMWRSSGWMAAIIGSFLLGDNMVNHRFTFDVGGRIDGPSAGCLMTVGVLAALLGHQVNPEATMTGTINPDGTVGPVGGIPQKLEGAVDAGKSLILIPMGSRFQLDPSIGQFIDVVEYGGRLGVQVKEVSDVYQAYELLTGNKLPKQKGVADSRPDLPAAAFNRTQAKVKEWLSRYTQERSRYDSLAADVKLIELEELMITADAYAEKSERSLRQGMVATAYGQALNAALYATSGYQTGKVFERLLLSGLEGAVSHLNSLATVDTRIDAMLERLKVEKPRTLDEVLALSTAYGNLTIAMGLSLLAALYIDEASAAETEEELYSAVFMAALYYALTEHAVQAAEDNLDVGMGVGEAPAPDLQEVELLADVLRRAAEANLSYFDTVVVADIAKKYGIYPEALKQQLMGSEMTYTFATTSLHTLPYIRDQMGAGESSGYAVLGGALASFQLSSLLITKYYSLKAEIDQDGNVISVANEKALMDMLDYVDRRARENINLARSVGAEAILPILEYETARSLREGSMEEKFEALQSFWVASLGGQILAVLSGHVELEE